jgi:hypothetical protein
LKEKFKHQKVIEKRFEEEKKNQKKKNWEKFFHCGSHCVFQTRDTLRWPLRALGAVNLKPNIAVYIYPHEMLGTAHKFYQHSHQAPYTVHSVAPKSWSWTATAREQHELCNFPSRYRSLLLYVHYPPAVLKKALTVSLERICGTAELDRGHAARPTWTGSPAHREGEVMAEHLPPRRCLAAAPATPVARRRVMPASPSTRGRRSQQVVSVQ